LKAVSGVRDEWKKIFETLRMQKVRYCKYGNNF